MEDKYRGQYIAILGLQIHDNRGLKYMYWKYLNGPRLNGHPA